MDDLKKLVISELGLKNIVSIDTKIEVIKRSENESLNFADDNFFFFPKFYDLQIRMNKILAEFISARVSHLHQTDPTINSIIIKYFI